MPDAGRRTPDAGRIFLLVWIFASLPAASDEPVHTVRALAGDRVVLRCEGVVDNRRPVGHALPVPRVPLAEIFAEGGEIETGAAIAVVDTTVIAKGMERTELQIAENRRDLALQRLRLVDSIADLEKARGDIQAQIRVYEAEIAATRITDQSQVAVAKLELRIAREAAERAGERADRLSALKASGHVAASELRKAEQDRSLAEAAARLPEMKLEILLATTNSITRRAVELALADAREQLGDETSPQGVVADLRSAHAQLDKQELVGNEDLRQLELQNRKRRDLADSPEITATASGLVQYASGEVRPGHKPTLASFAFVLGAEETIVSLRLPEPWRELIAVWSPGAGDGLAEVVVPALAGSRIAARVLAIAPAPEPSPDGAGRFFPCTLRLDRAEPRLRPGMRVGCELIVPARAAAVIPTWCVADLRAPRVAMADGTMRAIGGYAVGHDFVVLSDLAPGEQLIAPGEAARSDRLRLAGALEPERTTAIRLSRSGWRAGWELVETVPDGSFVAAGGAVARLAKITGDVDAFSLTADIGMAQARANLAIARINAERDLSQALVAWHRAALAVERVRLDAFVARYGGDSLAEVDAATGLVRAEVARDRAAIAAAELDDPALTATLSQNDRRDRALRLHQAHLAVDRVRLAAVGATRARDWLTVLDADEMVGAAELAATDARVGYSAARAGYQAALSGAQLHFRDDLARQRKSRDEMIDATVVAPVAGRVFQRRKRDGQAFKVGDRVDVEEPFYIPVGGGRRLTIEVPARFFARFSENDRVEITVPALGRAPRTATVLHVSPYFADSSAARTERESRGDIALAEKVFLLTLAFTVTDAEQDRVPPGTTAYVDL